MFLSSCTQVSPAVSNSNPSPHGTSSFSCCLCPPSPAGRCRPWSLPLPMLSVPGTCASASGLWTCCCRKCFIIDIQCLHLDPSPFGFQTPLISEVLKSALSLSWWGFDHSLFSSKPGSKGKNKEAILNHLASSLPPTQRPFSGLLGGYSSIAYLSQTVPEAGLSCLLMEFVHSEHILHQIDNAVSTTYPVLCALHSSESQSEVMLPSRNSKPGVWKQICRGSPRSKCKWWL